MLTYDLFKIRHYIIEVYYCCATARHRNRPKPVNRQKYGKSQPWFPDRYAWRRSCPPQKVAALVTRLHKTSERERAYELHKESCLLSICLLSGIPDPIEMNIYSTIHMSRIERVYVSLLMRKCRAFPALQRKRYMCDSLSVSLHTGY